MTPGAAVVFVDTNVLMYAVGGEHPLRSDAREFLRRSVRDGIPLATSAEVLQELLHAYLPTGRTEHLDAALILVEGRLGAVWNVTEEDVRLARALTDRHPALEARDLLHVASCRRREVTRAKTYDQALASVLS